MLPLVLQLVFYLHRERVESELRGAAMNMGLLNGDNSMAVAAAILFRVYDLPQLVAHSLKTMHEIVRLSVSDLSLDPDHSNESSLVTYLEENYNKALESVLTSCSNM